MRIAIFSDLHANADALATLNGSYDEVWFLGDIVGYGPDVHTAIEFVRENCAAVIRGNHDNAAVTNAPIGCSSVNEPLALATRDYTRDTLDRLEIGYLQSLPHTLALDRAGARFYLAHGSPRDPLYEYVRAPSEDDLVEMLEGIDADVVLLGHTHIPMLHRVSGTLVLNPGSLGQPRDGDWRSAYAVWEDGSVTFHRGPYDRDRHLAKIGSMPIAPALRRQLRDLLLRAQAGASAVGG